MADDKRLDCDEELRHRGRIPRRRMLGWSIASAGALGATKLAPWRAAFGQAKPYKIGTLQPLSGAAAAGGKTALVGTQMAVDRARSLDCNRFAQGVGIWHGQAHGLQRRCRRAHSRASCGG
jgi:hypothetical protein